MDEGAVCCVLPVLRGPVVILGKRSVDPEEAKKRGAKVAGDWEAEIGDEQSLVVRCGPGCVFGVELDGDAVPVADVFRRAFSSATRTPEVVAMAESIPRDQRAAVRAGYVMGLARAIQGVTRRESPLWSLSDEVEMELGE